MDTSELSTGEKVAIVGGAIAVVAAFLPWVSAGPFSMSGIDGDGAFTLIFGILAGAIAIFRDWDTIDIAATGILGVLTAIIAGNVYANLGDTAGSSGVIEINLTAGAGLHLTLLSGFILLGAAVKGYLDERSTDDYQATEPI